MLQHFLRTTQQPATGVIEYVGGQTAAISSTDTTITFSLTGGLASTPADGDLVVVTVGRAASGDFAMDVLTSGYTKISELYANDTTDANASLSYKFMTSTPDTSVIVPGKFTSSNGGSALIQVFRGVDTSSPLDVTTITSTVINTAIPDPASITPITSGSIILVNAVSAHSRAAGTFTAGYLTSFINLLNAGSTHFCTAGGGYVTWTSGAYNPAAFTFGGTDSTAYSNVTFTAALRPA